jgi:hypothetical protein
MAEMSGQTRLSLPSMGRVARRAGWGGALAHPLCLASLGTSPIEGEEGAIWRHP